MSNAVQMKRKLTGLIFMIAGSGFALLTLAISLTDGGLDSIAASVLLPLFMCFFIHIGYREFQKSSKENSRGLTDSSTWEKATTHLANFQLGFFILVVVVVLGGASYLFLSTAESIGLNITFYTQVITYLVYGLILSRLIGPGLNALSTKAGKTSLSIQPGKYMPSYLLTDDGFRIDLGMYVLGKGREVPQIAFRFSEITDLQVMGYQEAKTYLESQTGLGLAQRAKISVSSISDMMKFLNGQIERPQHYFNTQSRGSTLIIKGDNLLYAISVSQTDCSDLIKAWEASR